MVRPHVPTAALAEELGKVNSRIDDAVANRCALSLLLFMKKDLLQQKDPQAVTGRLLV